MKLTSILNKNLIRFHFKPATKNDAIKFLLKTIFDEVKMKISIEEAFQAIHERDELEDTSFEEGIAIPHARIENFNDTIIAIGIPSEPLFDCGKEIRMIVLILTCKSSSNLYLQTLSTFAKLALNADLFSKLTACAAYGSEKECAEKFLDILSEVRIKPELTAADIMSTELVSATPDTTIKELTVMMFKYHVGYVPVIDENGNFIAEVNTNDVLRNGIPNYAMMIGNLKFLSSFEPFEVLLANEDKIKVRSIMRKPSIKLSPDTSVIETALELTQNNRRHVPIVDGNKIVGIVSFMDILTKVIRG